MKKVKAQIIYYSTEKVVLFLNFYNEKGVLQSLFIDCLFANKMNQVN